MSGKAKQSQNKLESKKAKAKANAKQTKSQTKNPLAPQNSVSFASLAS